MKRRRIIALVLLAAGLALWFFLAHRGPTDETIELRSGAASSRVKEIDLHFQRDGAMERDLILTFEGGAPDPLRRTIKLRPGAYDLGIRVVLSDGRELHLARRYQTGLGEGIDLDLR